MIDTLCSAVDSELLVSKGTPHLGGKTHVNKRIIEAQLPDPTNRTGVKESMYVLPSTKVCVMFIP